MHAPEIVEPFRKSFNKLHDVQFCNSKPTMFWRGMCLYNIWMCIFTSTFEMVLNLEAHLTNAYVVGKSMKGFRNVWYGVSLKNKNAQQMYSHSIYVFLKILLYLLRILTRILGCFWIFQPYSQIWNLNNRQPLRARKWWYRKKNFWPLIIMVRQLFERQAEFVNGNPVAEVVPG